MSIYVGDKAVTAIRHKGISIASLRYKLSSTVAAVAQLYQDFSDAFDFKNGIYKQTRTRTNLLTYSQDFTNAAWIKAGAGTGVPAVVTADYGLAPDGTMTADRVQLSRGAGAAGTDYSLIEQQPSITNGTGSVWMKTVDGSAVTVVFRAFNGVNNLVTVTGQWQRFEHFHATMNRLMIALFGNQANGQTADLLVWGAQGETAPKASAYIPTTNAPASVTETVYVTSPLRDNLLAWSNDYSQSVWTKTDTTVSYTAAIEGPTGYGPLALLTEGVAGTAILQQFASVYVGLQTVTFSSVLKRGNHDWVRVSLTDSPVASAARCWVNLATGTAGSTAYIGTAVTGATLTVTGLGDGFYRVSVVATISNTSGAGVSAQVRSATADASNTALNNATRYQGNSQLELGSTATAYIGPTNGGTNLCCDDGVADMYGYSYTRSGAKQELEDGTANSSLGPELVTAPYAGSAPAPWSSTGTSLSRNGATSEVASVNLGVTVSTGSTYEVSFDVAGMSGDTLAVRLGGTWANQPVRQVSSNGRFTVQLAAANAGNKLIFGGWAGTAGQATVTNISVKEVILDAFDPQPANFPAIIPGVGYWSRSSLTNLIIRSQEFDTVNWSKSSGMAVTANNIVAPDGSMTADLIDNGAGVASNAIYQASIPVAASTTYTGSFWVRLGTMVAASFKLAVYNDTAAAFIVSEVVPTETITSTGWTRVVYTFTTPVGCTAVRFYPFRNNAAVSGTFYLWQAQLVAGSQPGPVIVTTSATTTVGADALQLASPITAEEDFIFFAAVDVKSADGSDYGAAITDGTVNNLFSIHWRNSGANAFTRSGGGSYVSASSTSSATTGRNVSLLRRRAGKTTGAYKTPAGIVTVGAEGTVSTFPVGLNQLNIGNQPGGSNQANDVIEFVGIRKGTFSDADITAILTAL